MLVAAAIVALAVLVAAASWWHGRSSHPAMSRFGTRPAPHSVEQAGIAATAPPLVQPVAIEALPPNAARARNAAMPFADVPLQIATPFHFAGTPLDRERAADCLAAADYYEAGTNTTDQLAVAQVVINRLHHPAFPKTLCGVVFQGAERPTGCQFTFTCDGSMVRRVPAAADWIAARVLASSVLNGTVDRRVGMATHYHTDWVVPNWNNEMLKIAQIRTHLFFRWPGAWGERRAFHAPPAGPEPAIAALALLSPAHAAGASDALVAAATGDTPGTLAAAAGKGTNFPTEATADRADAKGLDVRMGDRANARFVAVVPPSETGAAWALGALALCRGLDTCTVMGWRDPARLPATAAAADPASGNPSFVYVHAKDAPDRLRWNCTEVKRPDPSQCL